MEQSEIITLKKGDQLVRIEQGELVGYLHNGHEFIHQKGSPGWRSADTEMFPIIGPTKEAGFQVQVPRGSALLDQHGHLREMAYECSENTETKAVFKKVYQAGTPIKNSKYPEKSSRQWLVWPYSFVFEKHFELQDNQLTIDFVIDGEKDMPYMLGYHPAFRLITENPAVQIGEKKIGLEEVLAVGSRAMEVPETDHLLLHDERSLAIRTEGFGHFMLWTEVNNMICVEPISFYPYAVNQRKLHEGFQYLQGVSKFRVVLSPV
jgi:galactose mutarotase-like enzyme